MAAVLLWQQEDALIDRCRAALSSDCGLRRVAFTRDETPAKIRRRRIGQESGPLQRTGRALLNQIASVYHSGDYLRPPGAAAARDLIVNDGHRGSYPRRSDANDVDLLATSSAGRGDTPFSRGGRLVFQGGR